MLRQHWIAAVVAAVAALIGTSLSDPAHADRTYAITLRTPDHGAGDGAAAAEVILDYQGPRSLYFSSDITDRGEKDGRGAYLRTVLTFRDGTTAVRRIGSDTTGVGDEPEHSYAPMKTDKRIRHLRVVLQERDHGAARAHDRAASAVKANPFTG